MLPVTLEEQRQANANWQTYSLTTYAFTPFDMQKVEQDFLLQTSLPRLFDNDSKTLLTQMQTGGVIAMGSFGNAVIAILDVQTNAAGDVFLLYRANSDFTVELKDELGTHYLHAEGCGRPPRSHGDPPLIIQAHSRRSVWQFSPLARPAARPTQFTVICKPIGLPNVQRNLDLVLEIPVKRPVCALLPDFASSLEPSDRPDAWSVRFGQVESQAQYYLNASLRGGAAGAISEQAANLILQAMQRAKEPAGRGRLSPQAWFDLYSLSRQAGKLNKAREALRQITLPAQGSKNEALELFYDDVREAYRREGIK